MGKRRPGRGGRPGDSDGSMLTHRPGRVALALAPEIVVTLGFVTS